MERILSIAFALSCLLSAYSSHARQTSVQHFQPQPTNLISWTPFPATPPRDSYLPPLQPQVRAPVQPQLQVQQPQHFHRQTQPQIPHGSLQLFLLPMHSNAHNSLFYSPHHNSVFKVTKVMLNNHNSGHGPPATPTTTTPSTTTSAIDFGPLPPTPPLPTVPAITRDPNRRPYFRILLRAYENIGPGPDCSGGGEGRNPALTPIFGEEPGCPPAPLVTGSPQFGVPEPLSSSEAPPNLKLPPLPSHSGSPPSTYGAPPSEYGAPPPSTLQDENGQAGTGRTGATQAQASGSSGIHLDIGGGFK